MSNKFTSMSRLIRLVATSASVIAVGAASLFVGGAASAASIATPDSYDGYPRSLTNTSTCSTADVVTDSVTVGSWTGTDLSKAPKLKAGDVVSWTMRAKNSNCVNETASLALYASNDASFHQGVDQTHVRSNSMGISLGWKKTVKFAVPEAFVGPYQIDAVLGKPLPIVGPNGNYYNSHFRSKQSDTRSMLVTSANGSTDGSHFTDATSTKFDYASYPGRQLKNVMDRCVANSLSDGRNTEGFFVNGNYKGNRSQNFVAAPGDHIQYKYTPGTAACDGQEVSLAFYRNPNGGTGLVDRDANQRLVTSQTTSGVKGALTSLEITVPTDFRGGYQLDVVLGKPLPVVGNAGGTYSVHGMLKSASHNIAISK